MDLATLWFFIVGVLFVGYFVLDGFDFGVGMSLPFLGKDEDLFAFESVADLVAFARTDDATLISVDTAIGKAYTAIAFRTDTATLYRLTRSSQALAGLEHVSREPRNLVMFPGGVLVGDDARSLADSVVELLRDDALWRRLSEAGLEYARAVTSRERARARIGEMLGRAGDAP